MTDEGVSGRESGHVHDSDGRSRITDGLEGRLTSPSWLTRTASHALSAVALGFVALIVIVLETGGELTLVTRPLPMRVALTLPYLVTTLAVATAIGAGLGWRHHYWSLPARIHQTVLALLGLAFCWQLWTLGFLPV